MSSDVKLWVQPVSGGDAIQIGAGCRLFERSPVWAPDGSQILFVGKCGSDIETFSSQPSNYGVAAWISSLDGKLVKDNRELYGLWHEIHGVWPVIDQWVANPSRLLIPLSVGDATSITAVPISPDGTKISGPSQRLTFAGGMTARVSAALNGRIAISAETSQTHIWSLPIGSGGGAAGAPKQVTSGPAGESSPSLSADGEKLAFLSTRVNGRRLFYRDLGIGYDTPTFNRDGTKIMCVQYPKQESWRDFVFEVPISGGLSKKIWDKATWTWLWDLAPDDSILLVVRNVAGQWKRSIQELDLKSGAMTPFLEDTEDLADAHFSHDGRWVAFGSAPATKSVAKPSRSSIFISPFRKTRVASSEWIPITASNLDYNPRFLPTTG